MKRECWRRMKPIMKIVGDTLPISLLARKENREGEEGVSTCAL